jgi:hypothetical protein
MYFSRILVIILDFFASLLPLFEPKHGLSQINGSKCVQAKDIKIFSTMWDGKSCTAIAKTYLPPGRKLASSSCHLCLANSGDMSKPEIWERQIRVELDTTLCKLL